LIKEYAEDFYGAMLNLSIEGFIRVESDFKSFGKILT